MSYVNSIPSNERAKYSNVSNWNAHYNKAIAQFNTLNNGSPISEARLSFSNNVFINDVIFDQDVECHLHFKNCYFQGNVTFIKSTYKGSVTFAQCFCDGEFTINRNTIFEDDFDIIQLDVEKQLLIRGGEFSDCKWSLQNRGTLKISEGTFKHLILGYWGGIDLRYLSLGFPKVKGVIDIVGEKSNIEELLLIGPSVETALTVEQLSVNRFTMSKFRISDSFRIDSIQPITHTGGTIFSLQNSYMGSSEFNSIDFRQYEKIHFFESDLSGCSWNNIIWNEKVLVTKSDTVYRTEEEKAWEKTILQLETTDSNGILDKLRMQSPVQIRDYYFKKKEVLRQLKFAYGKQGDSVTEQYFHGLEMRAYNLGLDWEDDWDTKLIIKMSYWLSNFGQSFPKPLLGLLLGHLILFLLLVLTGGFDDLRISLCDASWAGLELALNKYLFYLNPLRRADNAFDGWYIIFDVFMRIWSSYMIYNIVRASRRFIK